MPKMPRPGQQTPMPLVRRRREPVIVDTIWAGVRIVTLKPEMVTPKIAAWLTDPAVMEGLNAPKQGDQLEAFRVYVGHFDNFARNMMLILEGDDPRGLIFLEIDPRHKTGSLHAIIGEEDARGRGVAPMAAIAASKHAFDDRKIEKLTYMPLERNEVAIAICEASNLKLEGILREHRIDGRTGERLDQRVYGLTRKEYEAAMGSNDTRVPQKKEGWPDRCR